MKRTIDAKRYKFLIGVVCLSALLVEGTGLAQQVRSGRIRVSRPARPRLLRGNLTAGPGAFVTRPVDTTDELLTVLRANRKVRQRYAKHFNISESKVVDFVKNALRVSRLENPRVVDNYYVTKAGRIKFHRERMPKGTKVWATRSGLPILKWICANPLTKRLPGAAPGRVLSESPHRSVRVANMGPPRSLPRMEGFRGEVAIPDVPGSSTALEVPEEAIESSTAFAQAPVGLGGVSGTFPTGIGGLGGINGLPLGIGAGSVLATPFLLPLVTGGGGGGGNGDQVIIPEPGTIALIATSLPIFLSLWGRRRSQAR